MVTRIRRPSFFRVPCAVRDGPRITETGGNENTPRGRRLRGTSSAPLLSKGACEAERGQPMKGSVWRVLLASFVLFLLSFGACAYGPQFERIPVESVLDDGMSVCGYDSGPSEWEALGGLLFLASLSVAASGAMLWWRAGLVGETHVRTPLLGLDGDAAGDGEAIETARDAAREE